MRFYCDSAFALKFKIVQNLIFRPTNRWWDSSKFLLECFIKTTDRLITWCKSNFSSACVRKGEAFGPLPLTKRGFTTKRFLQAPKLYGSTGRGNKFKILLLQASTREDTSLSNHPIELNKIYWTGGNRERVSTAKLRDKGVLRLPRLRDLGEGFLATSLWELWSRWICRFQL